jgi:hypothetical protein
MMRHSAMVPWRHWPMTSSSSRRRDARDKRSEFFVVIDDQYVL